MRSLQTLRGAIAVGALAVCMMLMAVDFAEARRGGGFGSRGLRTFDRPAPTQTAPNSPGSIDRSMTPRQQQPGAQNAGARQPGAATQPRGMFGGMFGGLLGGLMLGGMIGLLLGNGLGGLAGFLGLLLQVGIVVVVVMLLMRLFRGARQPAYAGPTGSAGAGPGTGSPATGRTDYRAAPGPSGEATGPVGGAMGVGSSRVDAPAPSGLADEGAGDGIGLNGEDFDQFEQLLVEVQAAFTREDYGALRELCTPEIVSYLSEELSQNALAGQHNDVRDVTLLQGDLSEAWSEGDREYATVAMRYRSVDIMRDRGSNEIVKGSPEPTETTEIWTFVRPLGARWQLSAIQDA